MLYFGPAALAASGESAAITALSPAAPSFLPVSFFPAMLSYAGLSVVPEGTSHLGDHWSQGCAGTGPFRVVRFEPGKLLELERKMDTISGQEGQPLGITVNATDPENDPLVYWADNLPAGAVFDPAERTLTWTPGASQAGTYLDVRFAVSDGVRHANAAVEEGLDGLLYPQAERREFT